MWAHAGAWAADRGVHCGVGLERAAESRNPLEPVATRPAIRRKMESPGWGSLQVGLGAWEWGRGIGKTLKILHYVLVSLPKL